MHLKKNDVLKKKLLPRLDMLKIKNKNFLLRHDALKKN